jgi:hypothetical protein
VTAPSRFYPVEPALELRELLPWPRVTWTDVDRLASTVMGAPCLGIPSARVAMCWLLGHLGYSRHRDHLLVPKFVGRCILGALTRVALPVEEPTDKTRAVMVVHQFGLRHDVAAVARECATRGWVFFEDSPYGVDDREGTAPGSLARFVGLGKVLPVAMGGVVFTDDERIAARVRRERDASTAWASAAWLAVAALRTRQTVTSSSTLAEAAYEAYVAGGGGRGALRASLFRALRHFEQYRASQAERVAFVASELGSRVLMPDFRRLSFVLPFLVGSQAAEAAAIHREERFDGTVYHVDAARNLFAPRFEKLVQVPVTPRIPHAAFERLVRRLATLGPLVDAPAVAAMGTR